jgi:hypothetical protein
VRVSLCAASAHYKGAHAAGGGQGAVGSHGAKALVLVPVTLQHHIRVGLGTKLVEIIPSAIFFIVVVAWNDEGLVDKPAQDFLIAIGVAEAGAEQTGIVAKGQHIGIAAGASQLVPAAVLSFRHSSRVQIQERTAQCRLPSSAPTASRGWPAGP